MAVELSSGAVTSLESRDLTEISARIRDFRLQRGWTLDSLATRAKLSKSYISRLEDGDRHPSIAALLSISRALGIHLNDLLQETSYSSNVRVVRGREAPVVPGNGLTYQIHSGGLPGAVMQPLRITISADRRGDELYRHDGEEWLYVLSGKLNVKFGTESHSLDPGDSMYFDATIGHRLTAVGGQDVEAILVAALAPRSLLGSYI